VSVYLDYSDPKTSDNWHACAQFALVLSNPNDPTNFVVSRKLFVLNVKDSSANISACPDAHHRFIPEECDWGFTRFYDLRKLFLPNEAHGKPVIENETAIVTVFVRVFKDPTGVLWHNFVKYVEISILW
jgi:ubiquitin carboxyl-terminal hydrolase 7